VQLLNNFEGKPLTYNLAPADADASIVQSNSLERIQSYIDIEHEPEPKHGGTPPAYWPTSGDIRVENLTVRYSLDGPAVLHDISFHIKAGQRIGVGVSLLI
jgi:ABC-type multidrug transport system fused ATPase/permease subunit